MNQADATTALRMSRKAFETVFADSIKVDPTWRDQHVQEIEKYAVTIFIALQKDKPKESATREEKSQPERQMVEVNDTIRGMVKTLIDNIGKIRSSKSRDFIRDMFDLLLDPDLKQAKEITEGQLKYLSDLINALDTTEP